YMDGDGRYVTHRISFTYLPDVKRCAGGRWRSVVPDAEQGHGRGEPVKEALAAHGPDLAVAEQARRGDAVELLGDRRGVVVRYGEHARAAAVAAEHERPAGVRGPELDPRLAQGGAQVLVGRPGVAHVEAHRLAHPHVLADHQGAA